MTRRIYVASFAPSYDEGGVGGLEWRKTRAGALAVLTTLAEAPGYDLRFTVLDMPEGMTDDEIDDFLSSGPGSELVDPPDPRQDLTDAIECWAEIPDAPEQSGAVLSDVCPKCGGEVARAFPRAVDPNPRRMCGACGWTP